ncbi:hypothetical protein RR48_04484 [Papilio machaon]|uniref:Uncharacterized protein n=1 Tax=Papilio machaon TaxID=76193 RepID=A0A0N1IPJ5_PAPMA|nr:hypothetical protein RR48_04484 [Papilio machaon]
MSLRGVSYLQLAFLRSIPNTSLGPLPNIRHLSRGGRLQVRRYVVHHAGSREFGEEHNTLEGAHIACGLRGAPRPTVASSAPSPRAPPPHRVAPPRPARPPRHYTRAGLC